MGWGGSDGKSVLVCYACCGEACLRWEAAHLTAMRQAIVQLLGCVCVGFAVSDAVRLDVCDG